MCLDGVQYCSNEVSLLNSLINNGPGRVAATVFVFLKIYLSAESRNKEQQKP